MLSSWGSASLIEGTNLLIGLTGCNDLDFRHASEELTSLKMEVGLLNF